ncbi:MAG: thiamine pyrophosphate-binding protein [Chloroflexi bacterium]|nr:thiamine pyrophosphate-binding protein [Chloroflexota bacterium]
MQLSGGQALAQALLSEGVEVVFGLPGVQLDWAFDGLYDVRERVRVLHTRHEQGAAYMADGYARTTGRPGVCLIVPGPGVLNAGAALATAYACSSPVLCLAGQVDSRGIGGGYGLLHELRDQHAVLGAITAWTAQASSPAQIPGLVREAVRRLSTGRPRPVALELPVDVLQSCADVELLAPQANPLPAAADPDAVREAARLLHAAERPVIYSGGGTLAAAAWDELAAVAELLEAPVVMSVDGRGVLSDRDDLAHTGVTGQALVEEADAVLAVGTRFWQPTRVWRLAPGARVIRIDADPEELARPGPPAVCILADARAALAALRDELDGSQRRPSRRSELKQHKHAAAKQLEAYQPQAAFCRAIRDALPDDAIVVNDLTQVTFFGTVGFPVYAPRTFIGPGYEGTLGSAFSTALGAQAGNPDRVVVTLAGDGGFLYTISELATQRQHALPVISIVFNDGAFGNVKRTQQLSFGGRIIAAELVNPDFVALARSFGVGAERVSTPDELGPALRSAISARAPSLIEVSVSEMSNVWPLIAAAGGIYPVLLTQERV